MTENHLTQEMRALLADALKDFSYHAQDGMTEGAPVVINGFLPPKKKPDNRDWPFVVVRPVEGSINEEETTVSVQIIVGCWSEEFEGYEYCLNILSRIRNALTLLPARTLARRFRLGFPIKWEFVNEQPYPSWTAVMTTDWILRTPDVRTENEDNIYGYFPK